MITLKNRQVLALGPALDNLDAIGQTAYKLKAKAIYAIARNITLISPVRDAIEKTRLQLNANHTITDTSGKKSIDSLKLGEEWLAFLEVESDVKFFACDYTWLNVYDEDDNKAGNVIPVSVIAGLLPILKGMPEPSDD